MTKRYGRSQKRQHRQRIADLEAVLDDANGQVINLRARLHQAQHESGQARASALVEYARAHGFIDDVIQEIGRRLAEAYPGKLFDHVALLMAAAEPRMRGPREPFALSADVPYDMKVITLRGTIPALEYCVRVADADLRSYGPSARKGGE